jgi:hypothetical protein
MKRLRFLGTSDILLSVRREVPTFMSTLSFVPSVSENVICRKLISVHKTKAFQGHSCYMLGAGHTYTSCLAVQATKIGTFGTWHCYGS